MVSQNLLSYKGKPICDRVIKPEINVNEGKSVSDQTSEICKMLTEITKRKLKKIKVQIEIENDSN